MLRQLLDSFNPKLCKCQTTEEMELGVYWGPLGKLSLPPYRGVTQLGIILCPRLPFPQVWLLLD